MARRVLAVSAAFLTAAVIAWQVTGFGLGHWLQVHLGIVNESGPYYGCVSWVGIDSAGDKAQVRLSRGAACRSQPAGEGADARSAGASTPGIWPASWAFRISYAREKGARRRQEPGVRVRGTSAALGAHPQHRSRQPRELPGNVPELPFLLRSGEKSAGRNARAGRPYCCRKAGLEQANARGTQRDSFARVGDQTAQGYRICTI